MEHAELKILLPAYALELLEQDETRQVQTHLANCSECQSELRAYSEAAHSLALAVPQLEPPPHLKRAILSRVRQPARANQTWFERWQAWWRSLSPGWGLAGGLAGMAVVLLLVVSNILLWQRIQAKPAQPAAVSEFQVIALTGTTVQPDANGLMVVAMEGGAGTLTVDGLAKLPDGQQYQLWLIKDGHRTSGGVFSVDEKGYAALVIKAPLPLNNYSTFGITIEPTGGSPGPTGPKVMGGKI